MVKPNVMKEKVIQLTNPFIRLGVRQGLVKGIAKGRYEGEVELILRQLNRRLGALPMPQVKLIRKLDLAKIETLAESLLEFQTRTDLARWLKKNTS